MKLNIFHEPKAINILGVTHDTLYLCYVPLPIFCVQNILSDVKNCTKNQKKPPKKNQLIGEKNS